MKINNLYKSRGVNKTAWFLIWIVIFSLSVWILRLILAEVGIEDFWIIVLLVGLGLTFISELVRSFRFKQNIYIDFEFFKWIIIYGIGYLVSVEILRRFSFQNEALNYVLISLVIITTARISKLIKFGSRYKNPRSYNIPWWVIIIALIVVVILLNNIYYPYKEARLKDPNLLCDNGVMKMKNNFMGMGKLMVNLDASITCMEYKSSRCRPFCSESGIPMCSCEATVLDRILYKEGEWLINAWFR